jgi:hypothetical protein
LRKEAPYTGGYGASKIQLLTGSDGEEGTLHHSQANLPPLENEKFKSVRGTRNLLRVNPKRPGGKPENERQAKIARPNGNGGTREHTNANAFIPCNTLVLGWGDAANGWVI